MEEVQTGCGSNSMVESQPSKLRIYGFLSTSYKPCLCDFMQMRAFCHCILIYLAPDQPSKLDPVISSCPAAAVLGSPAPVHLPPEKSQHLYAARKCHG